MPNEKVAPPVLQLAEERYRAELARGCPQAEDERLFQVARLGATAAWVWNTLNSHLILALARDYHWPLTLIPAYPDLPAMQEAR